jgi:predicted murein hydrolase (TIGR00659 family)
MERTLIAILIIVLTVVMYLVMNRLYFRFHYPILMPAITAAVAIVLILIGFNIPYQTYMIGGDWINLLLGPAVVSLAYPLYKQRVTLRENLVPIMGGLFIGTVVGMASGILFAKYLGFSKEIIYTLLPKSVTTPVAMQIASDLGGIPSLAAIFVMIAGFTGVIFGPSLLKVLRINHFIGQGVGFGTASHAIGTAKAFEYGEKAVSMSSVAMTVCAVIGSLLAPLFAWILLN